MDNGYKEWIIRQERKELEERVHELEKWKDGIEGGKRWIVYLLSSIAAVIAAVYYVVNTITSWPNHSTPTH